MENSRRNKEDGCVKCGTCNTVCPVYRVTGNEIHTPRGKQHLASRLRKGERSAHFADIFSKCLLCNACLEVCPRALDTSSLVVDVRSELPRISGISFLKYISRKSLVHPALFSGLSRAGTTANALIGEMLPAESGLRLRLAGFGAEAMQPPPESYFDRVRSGQVSEEGRQTPGKVNYFTGCLANYLQPEIAESTGFLLTKTASGGVDVPLSQTCCGMAALAAGRTDEARELARKNIRAFEGNNQPILTSCSSCYYQLQSYAELFADDPRWRERAGRFTERLREFSRFFLERFSRDRQAAGEENGSACKRVFYHDPCHLRFGLHIVEEPRELLRLFPGVDLQEFPEGPRCCGHGGLFQVSHPNLSRQIWQRPMPVHGSYTVVTGCSGCLLQWQLGLDSVAGGARAKHLAVYIAGLLR